MQDHKLVTEDQLKAAGKLAKTAGFCLRAQPAKHTGSGPSGGVGILVHDGIHVGPLEHTGTHWHRWAPYLVSGAEGDWVFFVRVYGYPGGGDGPEN